MVQETPYIESLFGREYQAVIIDQLAWFEFCLFGLEDNPKASNSYIRKGIFSWIKSKAKNFFGKLSEKPKFPKDKPSMDSEKEFQDFMNSYMTHNWQPIYEELKDKGTLIGNLSAYLTGNLKLPESTVKRMSFDDVDKAFKYKTGTGLHDLDELTTKLDLHKVRDYAKDYAKRDGAIHLAVYDKDTGEKSGRMHDIIVDEYRRIISKSIEEGKPASSLQSDLAYPDLWKLVESGKINIDEYNEWTVDHMNRDFSRIALTETQYAFNYGKLKQLSEAGRSYVVFSPG